MFSGFSRRQLLKLTGGLSVGGLGFVLSDRLLNKGETKAQTVFVRQNIASFTPAQITALRTGFQVMQKRPASNPTSLTYQANIHGVSQGSATAWKTCQHGSYFFFSWHRMYLYYFERILRRASGNNTLALPYWNYSDSTNQRSLPLPFRSPANTSNPLYVSLRNTNINGGSPLPSGDVSYATAFASASFYSPAGSGNSFGGQIVTGPTHFASPHGLLETRPHDQVHIRIGGWMGNPNTAANDPIFWLHHANIDRLWQRWLDQGGGRANPQRGTTEGNRWLDQTFTFFDIDANGNPVQVQRSGSQIINTVDQLSYRYDDDEARLSSSRNDTADQASQRPVTNPQTLAATPANARELSGAPVTLTLPLEEAGRQLRARSLQERSVFLNVEGIEYNPSNSIPYEIYINLPKGATPDPESPYYAGLLALFAYPPKGATFSLAITDVARELQQRNLVTEDTISVTFVPLPEAATGPQRTARSERVGFRRVTITGE